MAWISTSTSPELQLRKYDTMTWSTSGGLHVKVTAVPDATAAKSSGELSIAAVDMKVNDYIKIMDYLPDIYYLVQVL